jgi:hypothetical protein
MSYLFCEHCCFDSTLFFSKAEQKQFLRELQVNEDKRRHASLSARFLTQVANSFLISISVIHCNM